MADITINEKHLLCIMFLELKRRPYIFKKYGLRGYLSLVSSFRKKCYKHILAT